jgi:4-hydroxybenzoate polyprenyltransferase/phosphoglycolate phosphatase-like HAD superfamily hydrolase
MNSQDLQESKRFQGPIVVDLDGTLVDSDLLVEAYFLYLRQHPLSFLSPFYWLRRGKSYLKNRLTDHATPDASTLPYNPELMEWLRSRKAEGRRLVLATASDQRVAQAVADYLGLFDEVIGTTETNLSSHEKARQLVERFGHGGFEYVGNAKADVAVWQVADIAHVVNPEAGVLTRARRTGDVGQVIHTRPPYLKTLAKTLRLHQWAKNLLLFVPLLASHRLGDPTLWLSGLIAFLAFGCTASSVYLLNDLLDLPDDRRHGTKSRRPLAAGRFPIKHALGWIPALLLLAFGLSILTLPIPFVGLLALYYVMTLSYSLWLKRQVMLDVVTLALLYTLRVIAGAAAMSLVATFWILAFCTFIFLSLALLKRYTELWDAREQGKSDKTGGRGYRPADFELLASLGGSAGYLSVLVLALYIRESEHSGLYPSPERMWLACPLLLYWLSRAWLIAHRGEMHHDPIVFALRDRTSRWTGLLMGVAFALASLS